MLNPKKKVYLSPHEFNAYKCCGVIALLNALRYFDRDTIHLGGPDWQEMVSYAGCRICPCKEDRLDELATVMGLTRTVIPRTLEDVQKSLPVMLPLFTTTADYHIALAIGVDEDIVAMANYGGFFYYETVSFRSWDKIKFVSEDVAPTYSVALS